MDSIQIQVRFTIGNYSDALYYSLDEWPIVTPERLEADKQARYDDWMARIEAMSQIETTEE